MPSRLGRYWQPNASAKIERRSSSGSNPLRRITLSSVWPDSASTLRQSESLSAERRSLSLSRSLSFKVEIRFSIVEGRDLTLPRSHPGILRGLSRRAALLERDDRNVSRDVQVSRSLDLVDADPPVVQQDRPEVGVDEPDGTLELLDLELLCIRDVSSVSKLRDDRRASGKSRSSPARGSWFLGDPEEAARGAGRRRTAGPRPCRWRPGRGRALRPRPSLRSGWSPIRRASGWSCPAESRPAAGRAGWCPAGSRRLAASRSSDERFDQQLDLQPARSRRC